MPRSTRRFEAGARLAVAAAALAAFGASLLGRGWPRDDRWLILEHPLLRAGWPAARELLFSGYVQPVLGAQTPIHEWRPLLSLSFLIQRETTGFALLPFRAVNLALHVLVCLLLLEALRRHMAPRAAAAGALLFAVMPVHAEVVAYVTSRSEMLAALSMLGAWRLLGAPKKPGARAIAMGTGFYLAGSLCKEHTLLFPVFLALADWTFAGRRPWEPERRRVHLALGLAAATVMLGRAVVLPALADGGVPYFSRTPLLSRWLTLAKFWLWHYARPAAFGVGLCADYSRPLIPDARLDDTFAWGALAFWAAALIAAGRALRRRRQWGFWLVGPCLFLLPTSHLLMNLDTLGAQRFLYFPSIGLAALAGLLFAQAETRAALPTRALFAAWLLWNALAAAARTMDWRDELAFSRAATACNPVSARPRGALGTALIREGRTEEGERELLKARELEPGFFDPAYNLARLSYDRGEFSSARTRLMQALALRPNEPGALTLLAVLDERDGRLPTAATALTRAVSVNPADAVARFNLARVFTRLGRPEDAARELRAFLRLSPDDPDAPAARRWLEQLERASEQRPAERKKAEEVEDGTGR